MKNNSPAKFTADIRDGEVTVARAFEPLTLATVRQIMALNIREAKVIDISNDDTIVKALRKDPAHDQEEALKDIYRRLRPGDPPTVANARALLEATLFRSKEIRPWPSRPLQNQSEARD